MTGAGAASNKSAAQALRDRLKAKVGAKRASEPSPEILKTEPAAVGVDRDGVADSTGMDGATRRLRLGDSADTPSKRVKIESGVAVASKSEDMEAFAAGASAVVVEKVAGGEGVKAEGAAGVAAFWAELGGGAPPTGAGAEVRSRGSELPLPVPLLPSLPVMWRS